MESKYQSDRQFEQDVRVVADAVLEQPAGTCKPRTFTRPHRTFEVDGIVELPFITHVFMATVSPKLKKVHEDVERLVAAKKELGSAQFVKLWMVVEQRPEGQHVEFAKGHEVELLSLHDLRRRFFDGRSYLDKRVNVAFGSARDPKSGDFKLRDNEYIEPPMRLRGTGTAVSSAWIADAVVRGEAVVILSPFGSGKSLTLREVWFTLRKAYYKENSFVVPLAINLREHWGALHADEILRRHAQSVGLEPASVLTVAWRAGLANLLIDGFDEAASQGIAVATDRQFLRTVRMNALLGVRNLIEQSPNIGVLAVGRDHYFDDDSELRHALGFIGRKLHVVVIDEFDETRARQYLKRQGLDVPLPEWLPRRALLLGFLAANDLLSSVISIESTRGRARAWSDFVQLICERESSLPRSVLDSEAIQRVFEQLAIRVRGTSSGTGPIDPVMLADAYLSVSGADANESVLANLQRLPGLTERDSAEGSRSFVDLDLLQTFQGRAIARFVIVGAAPQGAYHRFRQQKLESTKALAPLARQACNVAIEMLRDNGWTLAALTSLLSSVKNQLAADLFEVVLAWAADEAAPIDLRDVELSDVVLGTIDLDEVQVSGLRVVSAVVDRITLGHYAGSSSLSLVDCIVRSVEGVGSSKAMPDGIRMDSSCEVEHWEQLATGAEIMSLAVPAPLKALLTVLKKLFRQKGSGRKIGAFTRGVTPEVAGYVPEALRIVQTAGLAWSSKDVVHPVWSEARRAHAILDNPLGDKDAVLTAIKSL